LPAERLNPAGVRSGCFHVDIEPFQGGHQLADFTALHPYTLLLSFHSSRSALASSILLMTSFFGPFADGLFEVGQLVPYAVLLMAFMPSEEEVKGHASLLPRVNCHERIVNVKHCICRDRGIGDEDAQIKLEILKTKIPYQQSSPATGLTPRLFPLSCG
jgi:hypothetical protein